MNPIKVLHFADFHLGSDFRSLGRKAISRKNDLKETFSHIIQLCRTEQVQLLLAVGDLFDNWSVDDDQIEFVRNGFAEIPQTNVFISAGNHDPLTADSPYLWPDFWSDNVHIFPARYESVVVDDCQVEVWGASFPAPYVYSSLMTNGIPQKPNYIQIGAIHGTLGANSEYNPISLEQIAQSGLSYLALGHIHKPMGIQREGKTTYAYPGCPEGRGFDELGPRGVLLGMVGKESTQMEFRPLCQRMYLETRVDCSDSVGARNAAEDILDLLAAEYGETYEDHLYKIYLDGKVEDAVNLSTESIRGFLGRLHYVKLRDRTQIKIDLEETANQASLKGIFVRRMLDERDDSEDVQKALKFGLKAFYGEVTYSED